MYPLLLFALSIPCLCNLPTQVNERDERRLGRIIVGQIDRYVNNLGAPDLVAGNQIPTNDVVQFLSPIQGIIYSSQETIATALKIQESRYNMARTSLPSGILKQTGGEPLSATELADIGAAFNQARLTSQTAVLNEFLTYEPSNATPDKMLMIESAQYSALDLSRLCGIPPYLVGVATGSYAYTSSEQSRADLYIFGVKPYAECIAATLSQNNVLPRGTYVKFNAKN